MTARPSPPPAATVDRAREIITKGPAALASLPGAQQFGKQWAFSPEEYNSLKAVRDRVTNYLKFADHKRPLCIAVFGPPGSGKSTGVKEIFEQLKDGGPTSLGWAKLNLTQFVATAELARSLAAAIESLRSDGASVPFIFFDEFDASLGGTPLGWLSWFLAPMEDGNFIVDGKPFELAKAVYVFAGGTAATMEEFSARERAVFRDAKGPDFVSRLQMYIDVRGPNDPTARDLRRGFALRLALEAAAKRTGMGPLAVDDAFLPELVNAGRYRHGQRSVEAVITMMAEQVAPGANLGRNALPPDFLLDMQVDRGPLDPDTIGGLIGLSGGGFPTGQERVDRDEMWANLARDLWALGGTVAYGGNWEPGGLTQMLVDVSLPYRLRHGGKAEARLEVHATKLPAVPDPRVTVVTVPAPAATQAAKSVRDAAHLFRMRWQSGLRCRARILLSGRTDGYSGRMPGIIEEAMIAIALRQPVYVLGGFGGAAALLGEFLGLATSAKLPIRLKPTAALRLGPVAHLFRPDGFEQLPLTTDDALSYLASHAIGGHGWTPNGLTVEENRTLFGLSGADANARAEALALIRRGLLRVFDR
jgi:hypothetical protein